MKLRKPTKKLQLLFKIILLQSIITGFTSPLNAQVTIGSGEPPHSDALLDLKENNSGYSSKGLLLPRVYLTAANDPAPLSSHIQGMFIYNNASSGTGAAIVKPGIYYNTGNKWEKVNSAFTNWFYMPSVVFDTSIQGTNQTKDLYQLYVNQFSTPKYKSTGAPTSISHLPEASDFYYYITDYDKDVFEIVSLSAEGILTYNIKQSASASTLINIIFAIK